MFGVPIHLNNCISTLLSAAHYSLNGDRDDALGRHQGVFRVLLVFYTLSDFQQIFIETSLYRDQATITTANSQYCILDIQ